MLRFLYFVALFVLNTNGDLLAHERSRGATLKPISACCEIPELGDSKPLTECSNPKLPGPCNDVQCVFEKSGFLKDRNTLNKEAYRNHLRAWSEKHKGWDIAIEKAIKDCVDKDLRQYLDYPCRAYDVFTCTGIAMLKVIVAQEPPEIPPECRGPPPDVADPQECCKIPSMFADEDLKACGIPTLDLDQKEGERFRGPPDCSKQKCILTKYNLLKGEDIDYEAVAAFLDKWAVKNPDFKPTVEIAKGRCLGELPGPPQICEADKMVFCIGSTMFVECPVWADNEVCTKLKNHVETCKAAVPKPL